MSMCGVREKTLLEELESLDLDQSVKDRLIKKYWSGVERHRAEIDSVREETYREVREAKRADTEKTTIISVLAAYIKEKELL